MPEEFDWKKITFENSQSLARVTALVEQTSKDVSRLAKHEAKIDRLIVQNGEIKNSIDKIECTINNDKKKLRLVYSVANHPKASFALLVSAYMLTFYEVRSAIGVELKPIVDFIKLMKGL